MPPFPSPWARRRAAVHAAMWESGRPTGMAWRVAAVAIVFIALASTSVALRVSPLVPIASGLMVVGFSLHSASYVGVFTLRRRAIARVDALLAAAVEVYAPASHGRRTTHFTCAPQPDGRLLVKAEDHRWFSPSEERALPYTEDEWGAFSSPVAPWLQDAVAAAVAQENLDAESFGYRNFSPRPKPPTGSRHDALAAHARLRDLLPPGVCPPQPLGTAHTPS